MMGREKRYVHVGKDGGRREGWRGGYREIEREGGMPSLISS